MSQNGLQKPPQGAKRAKKNEFENHRFVLFFAVVWEHRPAQESSKTAEKAHHRQEGPAGTFQKRGPLFDVVLGSKVTPK